MNPKAKIIVVLCAFLGFASASYAAGEVTCTRDLPDSYVPGQTVAVTLDLEVDDAQKPQSVIVKEMLPDVDWANVDITATPMFSNNDPTKPLKYYKNTGQLEWLFIDGLMGFVITDTSMDISYQVTPPGGETGDKTFSGQVLYNPGNITQNIGGDTQISGPEPLPTVYFSSASSFGSEAVIDVTLDVELSKESAEEVKVDYAVTDGTADGGGVDYTLIGSGTLTFSAGSTSENISITVFDDLLNEENETIEVTLSNPTGAVLGTNTIHTYTIQDDESQPSVEFEVESSEGSESVGTAELTVKLLPQSGLEVKVDYAVTGGDATGGDEDYTLLGSGTLTFSAGDTSEKISITIINDLMDENNETIEVTLSSPTNAILGAEKVHTYTILEDNDDIPVISFSSTGSEGDEGVSPVTMAVNLSPASAKTVTVSYTLSGDADEGGDYTISSPPLTFAPGETTKYITLAIVDDGLNETNETVTVTLSNPNNALLGANRIYTYTISDNDIAGIGFALVSSSGSESITAVTLNVVLSPAAFDEVKVDYEVTGGTADGDGVDYTLDSGTLAFSPGSTSEEIKIAINDDSIYEGNETIEVTLSNPTNDAELSNNITHIYTIEDDESLPIVEFDVGASEGLEDNDPAELIVNISGESSQNVEVEYSVTPGTAKANEDYIPVSGTLTFPAGETDSQTISIPIIDNELNEDDETFTVTLSNATNADIGTASHKYTILDNDNPPEVSFTIPSKESDEGAVSEVTLVVKLSEESGRTVTVGYSVSGMATRGEDYILDDGTLIFLPGETTKNIILTILDDDFGEPAEKVIVTLSADSETVEPGTYMEYTYKILNDDLPSVAFAAASSEGPEADSPAILPVVLSPFLGEEVTVEYEVNPGTAQAEDYTPPPGILTFPVGAPADEVTQNIEIEITNDEIVEPHETIIVTLSYSSDATIGTKASHAYTIVNDDDETPPEISDFIPEQPDQVARDTIIQLHITDEMIGSTSGVDPESVKIEVEGVVIYEGDVPIFESALGTCRRVEITESGDYLFVFQVSNWFDYEQEVEVVVHAEDIAGNEVNETYTFYTVMRSFGPNIQVNSDIGDFVANNPATARDSDGNIWVVWDEMTAAGDTDVRIAKLPADGGTFEASLTVVGSVNNQRNPAIAIDSDDVLYVVWEEFADPNWDILLLTSEDGITWTYGSGSDPCQVNADNPDDNAPNIAQNPAIAISGTKMYVTWDEKRSNENIWVRQSAIGQDPFDWKDATQVTDQPNSVQSEPAIAIDEFGTASIVWTDARNQDTTGTDIYGADSVTGPWENKVVVATSARESSPAIAAESSGTVLHLLWVDSDTDPNASIFYGATTTTDGLQEVSEADIHDVVDEPKYPQSAPAIAVSGAGETAKVFACWRDGRNIADPDIYYAETGSDFGTNILVNDDVGANTQIAPVIGIDKNGNPYMGWVDNRLGNNDIYGVGSTSIGPAFGIEIIAEDGGTVENDDDVLVEIPEGALPADTKITIAELVNPPSLPIGGYGIPYEFGPSGLVFGEPVTITIPHAEEDCPGHSVYTVYWYDPSILPPASPWTQEGISDVEHLTSLDGLPSGVHAIRFKTTHFTGFGTGGGAAAAAAIGGGGGGGGGGCDMSAAGQGNVIEYMLPYIFLTIVWIIIKRKDARNRKTIV
ncbi:MAG: hypothetical protein KAV87_14425 [Desulfobacteraceae bacterium]|nr:hypothetical protein [Desulfobacteraceae bacterium]